ncbi:hypothetical protein, partial [Ruegeria atlantica]
FREGLLANYKAMLSDQAPQTAQHIDSERPNILNERRNPSEDIVELATFLAEPPQRGARVFAYDRLWSLPMKVGVSKFGYLTDNFIYGDDRGNLLRQALSENPDVLVVIEREAYDWLRSTPEDTSATPEPDWISSGQFGRLREILSSAHVPAVPTEVAQIQTRWRRLVGNYLADNYTPIFSNDSYVVLGYRNEPTD